MAIVGHFDNLAEAQKLVQSDLLAGVVQEVYEDGQLVSMLPVTVIDSKSLIYNREDVLPSAAFFDIHEQIPWTADVSYATQIEVTLKRVARQDILDKFIMDTYKNPNDYRSIVLSQLRKGVMRTIEDKFIYGDIDNDSAEYDGISHLFNTDVAGGESFPNTAANSSQLHDMGGSSNPLTLAVMRQLLDAVRPKPSVLLMTRAMRNTLSAVGFEKGIVLSGATPLGSVSFTPQQFGTRVDWFDGIPIVISDYLLNEEDNSGDKDTTTGLSSIYAIRFGQIGDGGLSMCIGGDTNSVDLFKMTELEQLEDYDASGIRLVAYMCMALGSTRGLARIHSIKEDQVIIG